MQCQTKGELPCVLYCAVLPILLWLFQAAECRDTRPSPPLPTQLSTNLGSTSSLQQATVLGASVTTDWPNDERPSPTKLYSTPLPPTYIPLHSASTTETPVDILSSTLAGQDGINNLASNQTSTIQNNSRPNSTPKDARPNGELSLRGIITASPTHGLSSRTEISTTQDLVGLLDNSNILSPSLPTSVPPSHTEIPRPSLSPSVESPRHLLSPLPTATPSLPSDTFTVISISPASYLSPLDVHRADPGHSNTNSATHLSLGLIAASSSSQYLSSSLEVTGSLAQENMDYMQPSMPTTNSYTDSVDVSDSPERGTGGGGAGGTQDNVTYSHATPSSDPWNQTSVLPPGDDEGLTVGGIVGIALACTLLVVAGITIGLALYHRNKSRQLDTTKAQTNHYTGLWDDSVTLSYINNHFDFFQKDVQDEMVSLDNDAYLNSLEFMVFTNTWGDGKRNTRF